MVECRNRRAHASAKRPSRATTVQIPFHTPTSSRAPICVGTDRRRWTDHLGVASRMSRLRRAVDRRRASDARCCQTRDDREAVREPASAGWIVAQMRKSAPSCRDRVACGRFRDLSPAVEKGRGPFSTNVNVSNCRKRGRPLLDKCPRQMSPDVEKGAGPFPIIGLTCDSSPASSASSPWGLRYPSRRRPARSRSTRSGPNPRRATRRRTRSPRASGRSRASRRGPPWAPCRSRSGPSIRKAW